MTKIGTTSLLGWVDETVQPGRTYVYAVRAGVGTSTAPMSDPDIATTVVFTDDPIIAGVTTVNAAHINELRTAVNAVRVTAGLQMASFSDAIQPGVDIRAAHILELRTALAEARGIIGLPAIGFTDPALQTGTPIRAAHIQELRNGVK
jgi:hypothetical protein